MKHALFALAALVASATASHAADPFQKALSLCRNDTCRGAVISGQLPAGVMLACERAGDPAIDLFNSFGNRMVIERAKKDLKKTEADRRTCEQGMLAYAESQALEFEITPEEITSLYPQ